MKWEQPKPGISDALRWQIVVWRRAITAVVLPKLPRKGVPERVIALWTGATDCGT